MRTTTVGLVVLAALAVAPAFGADCLPTPGMTAGTHQKENVPNKVNISKGVVVSGRILSARDCKPISKARVQHWQAAESGEYEDRLRAYLLADDQGRYRFETEWPNLQIPHIHFRVHAPGHRGLDTQWVGGERAKQINFDIVLAPER